MKTRFERITNYSTFWSKLKLNNRSESHSLENSQIVKIKMSSQFVLK